MTTTDEIVEEGRKGELVRREEMNKMATSFIVSSTSGARVQGVGLFSRSFVCKWKPRIAGIRSTRVMRRNCDVDRIVCEQSNEVEEKKEEKKEPPFEIRGFSLANAFLGVGVVITFTSLSSYIASYGTASATSLGFVYGVPILLVGCALKYAELQPVEVSGSAAATEAREQRATEIQRKIYSDITRHRYGDEAHMAAALSSLSLVPRGEACPVLERAEEFARVDGEYSLKLVFTSVATPYKAWTEKIERLERFFGPGVWAEVEKLDGAKRLVAVTLTSGTRVGGA